MPTTIAPTRALRLLMTRAAAGALAALLAGCLGAGDAPTGTAPQITQAPQTVAVTEGGEAAFAVQASGGPLVYQWLRDGVELRGASTASLRLPAVGLFDDGARLRVRVSNAWGSALSDEARLIVTQSAVAPLINTAPVEQWVIAGQPAVFAVAATGSAPLTYQWLRDEQPVAGATDPLHVRMARFEDDGAQFRVTVSNAAGRVSSTAVRLRVFAAQVPPLIAAAPEPLQVVAGMAARFAVSVTGTGPFSYQWLRDGAPIVGATAAGLTLASASLADHGARFSVRVRNDAGAVDSAAARLDVVAAAQPPQLQVQPSAVSVNPGTAATFAAAAGGTAPLAYQWFRDGLAIAGATAASYTLQDAQLADSGAVFTLRVTNAAGQAMSFGALLIVSAQPVPPSIAQAPLPSTVADGGSAVFFVQAQGSHPLAYQWLRNGMPVVGATDAVYVRSGVTAADDGAQFSVRVSNAAGQVTSSAAALTVAPPVSAPVIVVPPQSVAAEHGSAVVLQVVAGGSGPLSYQWLRDGSVIAGATSAGYTLPSVSLSDIGARFSVVVGNAAGAVVTPVAVLSLTPSTPQVAAGASDQTLALDTGGRVLAWGFNYNGGLGLGHTMNVGTPTRIDALAAIRRIAVGRFHASALRADGALFVWGRNDSGEVGNGSTVDALSPVQVANDVVDMSLGDGHTLALTRSGVVLAWGRNDRGQLGSNGGGTSTPQPVGGLASIVAVAAGGTSSYALRADGRVLAWGGNGVGQLGLGDTADRSVPELLPLADVIALAPSLDHVLALHVDGRVSAWGANTRGQLGDGSSFLSTVPAFVAGVAGAVQVETGTFPGASFARLADGRVLAWGANPAGQLADGSTSDRALPITTLVSGVAELTVGAGHAIARRADGSLIAWGYNGGGGWRGVLGFDGGVTLQTTPAAVPNVDLVP